MATGGGDTVYAKIVARFSGTGVGTNAGVSVTHTKLSASHAASVSGIQFSGDAAALVTVESPAGTILFKKRYAAAFNGSEVFAPGTIIGPVNQDILVKISASTSNCEANLQGFDHLPGM